MASSKTLENAKKWLEIDKNPDTHAEIQKLVDANDLKELSNRLDERIVFGTAGLRARMQAGFSYMNDVTVIQASQGLGAYLLQHFGHDAARDRGVVVGHDHRHNSARFASLTAAAFITQRFKVHFYDDLVHTPLVPFGIKHLGALAGVMITASHNPARDNGYKVYWDNACQIIPPHDEGIFTSIEKHLEPVCWDVDLVNTSPLVVKSLAKVRAAYLNALKSFTGGPISMPTPPGFRFVYTPMHGVGLPAMKAAIEGLGLVESMVIVEEQALPDPDFPTVSFPNPEEKGALDLGISLATRQSIPLVIATDPDADRFAVAVLLSDASSSAPTYSILSGNQLGILFAAYLFETFPKGQKPLEKLAMLASTVSSQMLASMAKTEGFHYEETLTGFKWLGNVALSLQKNGFDAVYAFEEAIGYMFSALIPDKDGISAASIFLTAVIYWESKEGLNIIQKLEQLYKKYGYFESHNSYFISPSPLRTAMVFEKIRTLKDDDESDFPQRLGKRRILRWRDLTLGWDSATKDHIPLLPVSRSSEMITCELEGDVRFNVRGSGTEPKIKVYVECKAESREAAKRGADEVAGDLEREWFRPRESGLKKP
ncbi:phosphoglucomutase-like protein [Kalaharituber pfeilii]|nr:phosphoglucomutase-like protein [Kalaharituber pfeilii]